MSTSFTTLTLSEGGVIARGRVGGQLILTRALGRRRGHVPEPRGRDLRLREDIHTFTYT